jgi:hypothetical protein
MSFFNDSTEGKNRLLYLENRLSEIVEEAKHASEKRKNFLRAGYKLLLEEKQRLLNKTA